LDERACTMSTCPFIWVGNTVWHGLKLELDIVSKSKTKYEISSSWEWSHDMGAFTWPEFLHRPSAIFGFGRRVPGM